MISNAQSELERNVEMSNDSSSVLQYGCLEPFETAAENVALATFPHGLVGLGGGREGRPTANHNCRCSLTRNLSGSSYSWCNNFPHRQMNEQSVMALDRNKTYVVYCDGIGCNAFTKGAHKLARLGLRAKELLVDLDWWRRDGHPVVSGKTRETFESCRMFS